ncbi:nitroreductase family protein [Streptomyces sp. NPDC057579]|uniref:nitroreductase family protein n=1 Tax=Streptomyces sp. NPDC057579 TaxID=3346172 RepID=UPI00369F6168
MEMKHATGSSALREPDTRRIPLLPDHGDILRELQTRSRLGADDLLSAVPAPDPALREELTPAGAEAHAISTVSAPPTEIALETVLRRRKSVRVYKGEPIAIELLASVVQQAAAFDRSAWPDHESGAGLEFLVAARTVAGLPQGLYLYSTDRGDFTRLADLPDGEAAAELVLQLEYAHAPAIVIVCGPLAASLDRHGEHGHRLLLTRAGAAAQTAWLTALSHGLSGSIFAGFLSAALKPLVPVDGYRNVQLLAFSLGHESR